MKMTSEASPCLTNMKDDHAFNIWFVKEIEKHPCLYDHTDSNYNNRVQQEEAWHSISTKASGTVTECKEKWKNLRASFTRHLKYRVLELKMGNRAKKPYYLAEYMNFILPYTKARSYTEDNLRYYCDLLKLNDSKDNVIYLDSGDDTNYDDLKFPEVTEISHEDTDYPSNSQIQNENENTRNDNSRSEIFNEFQNMSNTSDEMNDTKLNIEAFKRLVSSEHDEGPETKKRRTHSDNDADLDFLKSLLPDIKSMDNSQKRKFKINVLKLIDEVLDSSAPSRSDQEFVLS